MIGSSDFVLFCNRTLDGMESVIGRLNHDQLNEKPDLPGSNSVFQLVTHSVAACEYWVAHVVCGRPSDRKRYSEFQAVGSSQDLLQGTAALRLLLDELRPQYETARELANETHTQTPLGSPWSVGAALIHAYEELAQHLGHMEITADVVLARQSSRAAERSDSTTTA